MGNDKWIAIKVWQVDYHCKIYGINTSEEFMSEEEADKFIINRIEVEKDLQEYEIKTKYTYVLEDLYV